MKKLMQNIIRVCAFLALASGTPATASATQALTNAAATVKNTVVMPAHATSAATQFVFENPMNLAFNLGAYAIERILLDEGHKKVAEYRGRGGAYQIYEEDEDESQQPGVGLAANVAGIATYYGIEHIIGSTSDYSSLPAQYLIAAVPIIATVAARVYARKFYNKLPIRTALKPVKALKRFLTSRHGVTTASLAAACALYILHVQQDAIAAA